MEVTEQEWERIEKHVRANPKMLHIDRSPEGACICITGFGLMHPKSFLSLMEESE
jgi:hypothetical protein